MVPSSQTDEEATLVNGRNGGSHVADEQTPLLREGPSSGDGDSEATAVDGASRGDANNNDERTVLADKDISPLKLWLILGTAFFGVFFGAADQTIVVTLSAPISSEFHSLSLLSWLATTYLIATAAFQPISGRLTDVFGRRAGLLFSHVFFGAGNLMCGLSHNVTMILAGRVISGIGGGGVMSIATFLASDLVPLRKRGLIQGAGNVLFGLGAMLGGVFGGLMNDKTAYGWRLAFLVQVPISAVSFILVAFLVRVPPKASSKSTLSRIDFLGSFLIISFLVLLLLGLNAGGNIVKWSDPLVLVTIPLSLVALAGFIWWESRTPFAVIPVRLLLQRTVLAACTTNLLATMVQIMLVYYIPLYLQSLGHTSTEAGTVLVASATGTSICSLGSGYIMKRTGKYVKLGLAAGVLHVAGVVIVTTLGRDSPRWAPYVGLFFMGCGYGAMLTVTLLACISAVDHSQQAVITSATYAFRTVGSSVGVTIGSAAYQNILKARLWERFGDLPGAGEEIARIRDDLGELKHLPPGWTDGVIASFMEAFRGVWLCGLGMVLLSLVCILFIKQHRLHSTLARNDE